MAPEYERSDIPPRSSVSRRDFLKTAGISSLAASVSGVAEAEAQTGTGPRAVGPGDVPVQLMVNGKRVDLRIEPRVTLLDAPRQRADLIGNKRGCDRGSGAKGPRRQHLPLRHVHTNHGSDNEGKGGGSCVITRTRRAAAVAASSSPRPSAYPTSTCGPRSRLFSARR